MRGSFLRGAGIAVMALAASFNLMGGLGTTCVALWAERFGPRMALLAPYRWVYIGFVVAGTATAVWEFVALSGLMRRRVRALRWAAASLVAGFLVAGVHAATSFAIRGSAAPADARAYLTAIALAVLLFTGRTGAFDPSVEGADASGSGGIALMASGVVALTVQHVVGTSHTIAGINHAAAWQAVLATVGWGLVAPGLWLLATSALRGRASSCSALPEDAV